MPLRERTRACTSSKPALDLPPPYRLVTLREVGDAFAHARQVAAEEGAGTLVYVGRFDLAEFAVVLEPEEPLKTARRPPRMAGRRRRGRAAGLARLRRHDPHRRDGRRRAGAAPAVVGARPRRLR